MNSPMKRSLGQIEAEHCGPCGCSTHLPTENLRAVDAALASENPVRKPHPGQGFLPGTLRLTKAELSVERVSEHSEAGESLRVSLGWEACIWFACNEKERSCHPITASDR